MSPTPGALTPSVALVRGTPKSQSLPRRIRSAEIPTVLSSWLSCGEFPRKGGGEWTMIQHGTLRCGRQAREQPQRSRPGDCVVGLSG